MNLNISKDILIFFQEMKQFFIKGGKKETMENYFRKFLLYRAQGKKGDFYQVLTKSVLNATPFVKLKSKKDVNLQYINYILQIKSELDVKR